MVGAGLERTGNRLLQEHQRLPGERMDGLPRDRGSARRTGRTLTLYHRALHQTRPRKLRGAPNTRRRGRHPPAHGDLLGRNEGEGAVAVGVGGYVVQLADEGLPLAEARGVGSRAGEELDGEGLVGGGVETSGDGRLTGGGDS